MFCVNCGKEIKEGIKFCPECGEKIEGNDKNFEQSKTSASLNPTSEQTEENKKGEPEKVKTVITAEDKEFSSIEEIISYYLPLLTQKKKRIFFGNTFSAFKKRTRVKAITTGTVKVSDVVGFVNCDSLLTVSHGTFGEVSLGWLFTNNAIYQRFLLHVPLVLKYEDIQEVSIQGEENTKYCVLKTDTGFEWYMVSAFIENSNALAQMMAQLSAFAKTHPNDDSKNIKSTREEEASEYNTKGNIIITAVASAIFAWNCYAIFHNFSYHTGYGWAILGIIVNIFALIIGSITFTDIFKKKFPKISYWSGYAYFLVLLLIFGIGLGHVPYKQVLAESAAPLVSQIIENAYGGWITDVAECRYVDNVYKITNHIYKGTAHLDNGNSLGITISDAEKGSIYVELDDF